MTKEQIIQDLIDKNGYKSYLEIGSQQGYSFNRVKCAKKHSVDPDPKAKAIYRLTSDDFFQRYNLFVYDVVLIDGLHHSHQVERDIINSSKHLTKNGAIVIHDTMPETELQAKVPRESKVWMGDVYKVFVGFRQKYPDVESYTHNSDCGVSVIFPKGQVFEKGFISDISFEDFMANKQQLLEII